MSHPRVEEVSDSDVDMSDPSEGDIDDFVEADIMRRVDGSGSGSGSKKPTPQQRQQQQQQQPPPQPRQPPYPTPHAQPQGYPQMHTTTDDTAYKSYQCLYPVYFDAGRSRAEGRRVPRALAVKNPLATEIVHACANLRLQTVLEAGKLHPKDWANPGRVKVNLRGSEQATTTTATKIKNKHHLYILVAKHLRAHPTTDASPALRVVVRGAPPPPTLEEGEKWPRPAVPRGWKMNELLPYYSPAMTGGGVSENFLKDMMKEMGGVAGGGDMASLLGGAASAAGGSGSGGGGGGKKGKGKGR
ncbi:signal recognition particle subunit [Madurella fahalii]|uniref:Signal recognition particle subunit n=1 Tax=Madurella fahalii TaxID=1157608 RepID=A0ABQ0G780_9PEZI